VSPAELGKVLALNRGSPKVLSDNLLPLNTIIHHLDCTAVRTLKSFPIVKLHSIQTHVWKIGESTTDTHVVVIAQVRRTRSDDRFSATGQSYGRADGIPSSPVDVVVCTCQFFRLFDCCSELYILLESRRKSPRIAIAGALVIDIASQAFAMMLSMSYHLTSSSDVISQSLCKPGGRFHFRKLVCDVANVWRTFQWCELVEDGKFLSGSLSSYEYRQTKEMANRRMSTVE
jgi:hypothetical protein